MKYPRRIWTRRLPRCNGVLDGRTICHVCGHVYRRPITGRCRQVNQALHAHAVYIDALEAHALRQGRGA